MFTDEGGEAWWHWLIGAILVVVAAVAVVATAGGALAGVAAVTSVLAGGSAATLGATIAAGAFIGAVTTFAAMGLIGGIGGAITWNNTGSFAAGFNEFESYGETAMWSTLGSAIVGGVLGGISYKINNTFTGTKTPGHSTPNSKYINIKNPNDITITHYDDLGNMNWSKHLSDHGFPGHAAPHWHFELPHSAPYNSRLDFIIEYLRRIWWFK